MSPSQIPVFRRLRRSYQRRIQDADELACILDLDEARWVATSAPVDMLNCDATFLKLVDADGNGRITCAELKRAVRWLLDNLCDRGGISEGTTSLRLDAINSDTDDGRRIRASARKALEHLGCADADAITLEQIRKIKAAAEAAPVGEAGVVLPEATEDEQVRRFLADIIAVTGGAPHPSGRAGLGQAQLDEFLQQARAFLDWLAQGEPPDEKARNTLLPLGSQTARAYAVYHALRGKLDQYFAQCRLVRLDPRAREWIWPEEPARRPDPDDPAAIEAFLEQAPLAAPRPDAVLRFEQDLNPHYAAKLAEFRELVAEPLLHRPITTLTSDEWEHIQQRFGPYEQWLAAKPDAAIEAIGREKLEQYLDPALERAARELIAQSKHAAIALEDIRLTEKLILYQAYLLTLANNFVRFPCLYDPNRRALFEMGTLIMDGRRFNFSIKVTDRAEHSRIADTGNVYLLYVRITPPPPSQAYEVAVPVTSGSKGNLCVGKRGIFRDVAGLESDAQVVQILDNPISIAEAFVSPFRRIGKTLTGKIEAMTAVAEKKLDATAAAAVEQVQATAAAPSATPASRGLLAGGLLMGGGVAVAALGSAAAYIGKTLAGVAWYKIVLGLLAAALAVVLPSSIVAFLKLRRRDLSAILEGSGWAINARMRLTFRQGRFFTQRPRGTLARPANHG